MAWIYLVIAGVMEPCWVIGMKMSAGFKKPKWTVATIFFIFASMYLLAIAIDMDLPVGTAYAVWTGIGAVGTLVAGIVLFKERAAWVRVFFIMLIVIGIAGVQVTSGA
ncbi:MAG: multidrug efflux SMR transporter [Methanomassiliicoccales archaeon]|jgi:quaternary ammonium compound-resistance protein SugE